MTADNTIGNGEGQPQLDFEEIFKRHRLDPLQKRAVIVNVQLLSHGIIDYLSGPDPEDGLETIDVWLANLDMTLQLGPGVAEALGEIFQPLDRILNKKSETSGRPRKRH